MLWGDGTTTTDYPDDYAADPSMAGVTVVTTPADSSDRDWAGTTVTNYPADYTADPSMAGVSDIQYGADHPAPDLAGTEERHYPADHPDYPNAVDTTYADGRSTMLWGNGTTTTDYPADYAADPSMAGVTVVTTPADSSDRDWAGTTVTNYPDDYAADPSMAGISDIQYGANYPNSNLAGAIQRRYPENHPEHPGEIVTEYPDGTVTVER
jgi:hypothetical protein